MQGSLATRLYPSDTVVISGAISATTPVIDTIITVHDDSVRKIMAESAVGSEKCWRPS